MLKYHAKFQEAACSLDLLLFVIFLDDLFQEGLVLKKAGLALLDSPMVRLEVLEMRDVKPRMHPYRTVDDDDFDEFPRKYTLFMKRAHAYSLLKQARLKILKADLLKKVPDDPLVASIDADQKIPAVRQLSAKSILTLKALWDSLTIEERGELAQAYETDL